MPQAIGRGTVALHQVAERKILGAPLTGPGPWGPPAGMTAGIGRGGDGPSPKPLTPALTPTLTARHRAARDDTADKGLD